MSNNKTQAVAAFAVALENMDRTCSRWLGGSGFTVNATRQATDEIALTYDQAETAYNELVAKTGSGANARALIADYFFDVPADVGASLVAVRNAVDGYMDAYDGMVPAQGARTYTFDRATERHAEIQLPAGNKTTLDTEVTAIQTALAPFIGS